VNVKELAKRCRDLATDYASGSLWCGREEETAQHLSEAAEALERCAELEADAERLDYLETLIRTHSWCDIRFWPSDGEDSDRFSLCANTDVGNGETLRAAIDALRSRESNPTKEP